MTLGLSSKHLIVFVLFAVAACAVPGSYVTSTMNGVEKTYRYDEGGKKVLVYELDRGTGKATVYDPNDKRCQQYLEGEKWQQKAEAAHAARQDRIRQAPKRRPNDPIMVRFKPIDDSEIQLTEKQKKDMYDYFRKQIEGDPVIRLVAEERADRKGVRRAAATALKDLSAKGHTADVDVVIKVTSKTVYGTINNKLAEAKEMTFQATIISNWLEDSRKASDAGTLFDIPKATQRLSEKVRQIIKNEIGPTIPADKSI